MGQLVWPSQPAFPTAFCITCAWGLAFFSITGDGVSPGNQSSYSWQLARSDNMAKLTGNPLPSEPTQAQPKSDAASVQETAAGSGVHATGHWLSFLMPSVSDLLFITLLLGLSCGALGRLLLRDADTGWHIRDGQQIMLTHAVPRVDTFSATMSGRPWYAWEWLYDLLIAIIHRTLGLNGVVFYTAAIIAATFVLVFHVAMRRGGSLPMTLFLLIVALGASSVHFLARPHVVSWLFSVVWFEILDSAPSSPTKRQLFWLPPLMLLWANLHGGFLFGLILLAVYVLAGTVEYLVARQPETRKYLERLGAVSALSLLAGFINPYGYKLHVHIYRYLSDRYLMNRISEFLAPNFHGAGQQCFALLLLIAIVAQASARRRLPLERLLVLLLAAYSGLYATRNLPVSSLLIVLIIAPQLSETIFEAGKDASIASWLRACFARTAAFGSRMESLELRFRGHVWLVLVFVLGLWACANNGRLGSTQFINAYFDEKRYPVEAAEVIAQRGIDEPVFSLDYWGGYLIYRLYPKTKVVVDDRHDLYGDQFIRDYEKVTLVQPGWKEVLDVKHVNRVLMPAGSSLANVMKLTPAWSVVHEDGTAVLFERVSPTL